LSVQILGLREWFDERDQKFKKKEVFFSNQWRAPSVELLFRDLDTYIDKIPQAERFNLYYTVSECFEEKGRKLKAQRDIPFDIDDIDVNKIDDTINAVLHVLKVPRGEIGIVFSGNGLQFIVGTSSAITDDGYFETNRDHYRAICDRINLELNHRKLPGVADPSVWSAARLMRLPKTLNKKPNKPEREAKLLNALINRLDFKLATVSMLPVVSKDDYVSQVVLDKYPPPDTAQILTDCEFLKRAKNDPKTLPEPEWYAMLSITAKLKDGVKISHEYSKGHPGYSREETDLKISQAMKSSGPRTCKNINNLWGKCQTCKHFNTPLTSPIMIRGPNYIKTAANGFHEIKHDANGNPKPGKPNFEDLRRFFEQKNPYISMSGSEILYTFNGTHWVVYDETQAKSFAHGHFNPKSTNIMRAEFLGVLRATNVRTKDWFNESIEKKMNFKNGILDLKTMEILPHSKEFGFRYVLPYNYEPEALAPRFAQFLQEITCNRQELIDVILEYAGYSFSNDNCWTQKALLLVGEGANGKSTLLDLFKRLAGEDNYSSLTLSDLKNDANRFQLEGKLFNLAEETATSALLDSSLFKNLVTGGETMVKMLYHQPFRISNRTKLLFACNELPRSKDTTAALFRRILIVPFDATFTEETRDTQIHQKLFSELPGIFNYIIKGYQRLIKQQKFSQSNIVDAQLAAYQRSVDPITIFADEAVEILEMDKLVNQAVFTSFKEFYNCYKSFVEERSEDVVTQDFFVKRFTKLIPKSDERLGRKRDGEKQNRGLRGVRVIQTTDF
jgi:putative DNA primase/helicase